jgi:membrane fusion protein (multidrug efflux system)
MTVAACKKNEEAAASKTPPAAPLKVNVGSVETLNVPQYLTLTGSIVADQQSEVAANVSGRIVATYVERGQTVKKGQALALVDAKGAAF